jgi:hypothetical protein
VGEYTLRIYGLPVSYQAIAIKVVWEYPLAYRAFEAAKQILEVQSEAQSLDHRSQLAKLLRVEKS